MVGNVQIALDAERASMGKGNTLNMDNTGATQGMTAKATGYCRAMEQVLAVKPSVKRSTGEKNKKPIY